MTSWRTLPIPADTLPRRPRDEAVPRLARCCELVEALDAVAAAIEPGHLRLVALEALGRRYL